jgi:hypothetical protein
MKTRIDAHDDVALRDEETIAWWAMAHNMDDDRVPCDRDECRDSARWVVYCSECRARCAYCTPHRAEADGLWVPRCGDCDALFGVPIPWLPM